MLVTYPIRIRQQYTVHVPFISSIIYLLQSNTFFCFSCKEPIEPLTLEEIAHRCHAPEEIEMIYKIVAHMEANDRALIAEGSCGSPRSIKVFLGECNVDDVSYA